jgi:C-terminal processing protease CtpA/Prc
MKKLLLLFALVFGFGITIQSCQDLDDTASGLPIQNFIWKGLNLYYLWQADVSDLADGKFPKQNDLNNFLATKSDPKVLFQDLLFKPVSKFPTGAVDRFSVLVDDYSVLENLFQGITTNNGVDFGLRYKSGTSGPIFGWVRYIIPNSDASAKNIKRGDIFYAINGTTLTADNYRALLGNETYTLNFADFDNGNITPNGRSLSLTKSQLTENPILLNQIIPLGTKKVAYLVYNGFTSNFDTQLNQAFGQIKAAAATHLVLDLRYNSGGSVQTATYLASMITGQFTSQVFAKQQWNAKVQSFFEANSPQQIVNNFTNTLLNGQAINSLNLTKVYILTTRSSASASELLINGLKPYVSVIQIGDLTTGKNVGSITLYDSPNFRKENRSAEHKYAMQPLVLKIVNKTGFGDYQDGLIPTIDLKENLGNLSQLGNINEPLLSTALGHITINGRMMFRSSSKDFAPFMDSKSMRPFGTEMYLSNFDSRMLNGLIPF